jgi:hypothetical protein
VAGFHPTLCCSVPAQAQAQQLKAELSRKLAEIQSTSREQNADDRKCFVQKQVRRRLDSRTSSLLAAEVDSSSMQGCSVEHP